MNRNMPPPPLHITMILNFGVMSVDANAPRSYWQLMSPVMSRVVVSGDATDAPTAVEVHPSMPLTPRLQSQRLIWELSISWA